MNHSYDDIIHLPHHVSNTRPRMPIANRAAQFAPFAALSGYDAAVKETARLTDRQIELGESELAILDRKLQVLADHLAEQPEVAITYFQPDEKKAGGAYVIATGRVKKVDDFEGVIVLTSGERILFKRILEIESDCLKEQ